MRRNLIILIFVAFIFCCSNRETKLDKLINQNNLSFPQLKFSKVKIVSLNKDFDKAKKYEHTFIDSEDIISLFREKKYKDEIKVIDLNYSQIEHLLKIYRPAPCKKEVIPDKDCVPAFRDAILFFNSKNNIIASVSICFDCESVIFKPDLSSMCNFEFEAGRISELTKLFEESGIDPKRFLNKKKETIPFLPPSDR